PSDTLSFDDGSRLDLRLAIQDDFNIFRIDVHACRSHNHFFLASFEVKIAFRVHLTNVARAKPARIRGSALRVIAPVSGRNIFAAHQNFSVLGQLHFLAGHHATDRAMSQFEWMIDADERRGFGHAIALNHRKTEPPPKFFGFGIQRCTAGDERPELPPEHSMNTAKLPPTPDEVPA